MGRTDYRVRASGMTEQQALSSALERDRNENGHQDGYSGTIGSRTTFNSKCIKQPKLPKRCKVEKQPKVKIKWETRFICEPRWASRGDVIDRSSKTKGEAIKKAKELALKHNCEYCIRQEKVAINPIGGMANTTLAVVTPEKGEMGVWEFWGECRE